MSINSREDFLAWWARNDLFATDHLYFGRNRLSVPGTYTPDWDTGSVDAVTFVGTSRSDTYLGGGGELVSFFLGSRGNDLYGGGNALGNDESYASGIVDYSGAKSGVIIDMDLRGSRTFTDEAGETRTVSILGRALKDGFGGQDDFMEGANGWSGYSSVTGVIGSRYDDVMKGQTFDSLYGGRGNDYLEGNSLYGGQGRDTLVGKSEYSVALFGDEGDDILFGADNPDSGDVYLVGGEGNDVIFAGAGDDRYLTGDEGKDFIDGGDGNDFIDGGVGADIIHSGAGNDTINPDVEWFQRNSYQARDGARDIVFVTRADLGAYTDTFLFNSFEEGKDQIRFADAVRGGRAFEVRHEPIATLPGRVTTVLQIDQDGDGLGDGTPDLDDYFLRVAGADLNLHGGLLLT